MNAVYVIAIIRVLIMCVLAEHMRVLKKTHAGYLSNNNTGFDNACFGRTHAGFQKTYAGYLVMIIRVLIMRVLAGHMRVLQNTHAGYVIAIIRVSIMCVLS